MHIALTSLQALCIPVLALGTMLALWIGVAGALTGIDTISLSWLTILGALVMLAADVIVSVCSYRSILAFFRMCGRLKTERAFTNANAQALHTIARMSLFSAAAMLLGVLLLILVLTPFDKGWLHAVWSSLTFVTPIYLLAFMYGGVGVICHTLRQLLCNAMDLQAEQDLTV